jgi:hypothetical protein
MTEFPAGPTVEAFLEAARYAGDLIASEPVGRFWSEPSVLAHMTVGDVAGHLFLVVRRVGKRAEGSPPATGAPRGLDSVQGWTWIRVDRPQDLERPEHQQVRADADHVARWGWESVRDAYRARTEQVSELLRRDRLPDVSAGSHSLSFSAYLATRVVEVLVHADDLGCSVGQPGSPPAAALDIAIQTLFGAARSALGDVPVLRALSRRERGPDNLSVF